MACWRAASLKLPTSPAASLEGHRKACCAHAPAECAIGPGLGTLIGNGSGRVSSRANARAKPPLRPGVGLLLAWNCLLGLPLALKGIARPAASSWPWQAKTCSKSWCWPAAAASLERHRKASSKPTAAGLELVLATAVEGFQGLELVVATAVEGFQGGQTHGQNLL